MTEENDTTQVPKMSITNNAKQIASDIKLISIVKDMFSEINRKQIKHLIEIIMSAKEHNITNISLSNLKLSKNKIQKNKKRIDFDGDKPVLREDAYDKIVSVVLEYISKREHSNIKDIDEEDANVFTGKKVDGKKEVNNYLTYLKLIEDVQKNTGEFGDYLYNFKDTKSKHLDNTDNELQIVNLEITTSAHSAVMPILYGYKCEQCSSDNEPKLYYRYPIDMVSVPEQRIKCNNVISLPQNKTRKCGALLKPSDEYSVTKKIYIYDAVVEEQSEDGTIKENYKIVSFKNIMVGPLIGAVVKTTSLNSEKILFLVDYKIEKENEIELHKDASQHNIFNYIHRIDQHIQELEGYKHFGFLPMKIAMIIQYAASVFPNIDKNYHMALTGGASTGKTIFSKYWGAVLYGPKMLEIANVTDISIPALRGTTNYVNILGKKVMQRSAGYLNTNELIIINELSSERDIKKTLKGHLFNPEYSYAKAGGDGIQRTRNAQFIITENINPEHTGLYINMVKKFYHSDECVLASDEFNKPQWNDKWDLFLELTDNYYDDKPHLRFALYTIRNRIKNENKNWIDGDEIAADDRFPFYFFVNADYESKEMTECFIQNRKNMKNNKKTSRLVKNLYTPSFEYELKHVEKYLNVDVKNEDEYLRKLHKLIIQYDPYANARYVDIMSNIMKILRAIDERDHYIDMDLKIIQYLIEKTKSKLEVYKSNKFVINGPKTLNIPQQSEYAVNDYFDS